MGECRKMVSRPRNAVGVARRWGVLVRRLLLGGLLSALLASCHGITVSSGGHDHPLLPKPLRAIALGFHHLGIVTGAYVRRDEADDHVTLDRDAALAGLSAAGNADSVTWLGHSTALIRLKGVSILTDPVLADGIVLGAPLPHRHVEPPIGLADLPKIDVVLISHGDYDHLHLPSLKALVKRFPKVRLIVPEGLQPFGEKAGFARVDHPREGGVVIAGATRITALPAVHATRRNLLAIPDGKANSWDIRAGTRSVLFVGDSAYGSVFRDIGRSRGPFDLALVPIGAFEPATLVSDMHSSPEDAARILDDVRAGLGIGIHWGTFALSPEPLLEPAGRFLSASASHGRARVVRIGETMILARSGTAGRP